MRNRTPPTSPRLAVLLAARLPQRWRSLACRLTAHAYDDDFVCLLCGSELPRRPRLLQSYRTGRENVLRVTWKQVVLFRGSGAAWLKPRWLLSWRWRGDTHQCSPPRISFNHRNVSAIGRAERRNRMQMEALDARECDSWDDEPPAGNNAINQPNEES